MDWGTIIVQVTALIGGLAAFISILTGINELREKRLKSRERASAKAATEEPPPPLASPTDARLSVETSPATPPRRITNLPSQPTGLIGREQELAELAALLRIEDVRLVTLTGPAGIGKTRLALQLASQSLADYTDGVFLASLASITDPGLVIATIARALDLREQGSKSLLDILKDYLNEKQMLLVLDNFEHVMGAAPVVAELIAAAPKLKVLVTSREVLRIYGERAFVVPPLALPAPADLRSDGSLVSTLARYEAVRLFVARAQAANPDFALNEENATTVVEICRRLDGVPLAIELAAARIRLLPPRLMLEKLTQATGGSSLQLLTGGPRDLPARQQTLRDTITWSYDLLDETERTLFQRLAVFAGGWTIEAAEAVCNIQPDVGQTASGGENDAGIDALNGIESLLSKSLVRAMDQDAARFTMLQTIRAYALERLEQTGMARAVRDAHAAWYLQLARQAEPQLYGAAQTEWLQRLEVEYDNLRAALSWTLESRAAARALALTSNLAWFWNLRGRVSEGRGWLEAALALPDDGPSEAHARSLSGLAELASNQGDWTTAWSTLEASVSMARELGARQLLARALATLSLFRVRGAGNAGPDSQPLADESLALARALGDPWTLGYVLTVLDVRDVLLGHRSSDPTRGEEALACFETVGDKWGMVLTLRHLGVGAIARGDYPAARVAIERAFAISRTLGDRLSQAYTLTALGDVTRIQGDYEQARAYYESSLTLYRDLGLKVDIPAALHNLGYVALGRGDIAAAQGLHAQSLALHQEAGNSAGMVEALSGLAAVALARGQATQAARLFGAVEGLRATIRVPLWPAEQVERDRHTQALTAQMNEAERAAAWAEGQTMTLEQAVAEALEMTPTAGGPPDTSEKGASIHDAFV